MHSPTRRAASPKPFRVSRTRHRDLTDRTPVRRGRPPTGGMRRTPVTLAHLLNLFRAEIDTRRADERLSASSHRHYYKHLLDAESIEGLPIADLDASTLEAWVHRLRRRGPATAVESARILRRALRWGREQGLVVGDPGRAVWVPPHKPRRGDPMSREDLARFIDTCRVVLAERELKYRRVGRMSVARHTAVASCLLGMALMGHRSGGMSQARCSDYDGRTLRITSKGRVFRVTARGPANELLRVRQALVGEGHAFLFPGWSLDAIRVTTVNKGFQEIAERAGVLYADPAARTRRRHAHDLRHSFMDLGRQAGASWADLAELSAYSNIDTLRETYTHTHDTLETQRTADTIHAFMGVRRG
jgi:integrase